MAGQNILTRGSLWKNLLIFTLPFLGANFMQALYGAVDLWMVGKYGGGKVAVTAVSIGSEVMFLVMSFVMGLCTGSTVLIGQFFGGGDGRNTRRSIGLTITMTLLLGVAGSIALRLISPLLVALLKTPAEAIADSNEYLEICSWGVLFIFGYNALSAIFRGFGNSNAPLLFVAIACICNLIGDYILVAVCHTGVRGAAIATISSQALSMIFALIYLKRGKFGFRFALPYFRVAPHLCWKLVQIGTPVALQGILINLSFLFIASIVNTMSGDDSAASAAYGIANKLNGFTMLPAISFSMATAAITAQNIGAHRPQRALKSLSAAIILTMSAGVVFLLLMQLIPEKLIALFIDRSTVGAEEVIRQGTLYIRSFSWEYILVPIVFCTNGFFNGCGKSFFSMANNLAATFFIRVPVSWFFSVAAGATLFEVGMAAPLASFASNIVALVYLFSGRWQNDRPKARKRHAKTTFSA